MSIMKLEDFIQKLNLDDDPERIIPGIYENETDIQKTLDSFYQWENTKEDTIQMAINDLMFQILRENSWTLGWFSFFATRRHLNQNKPQLVEYAKQIEENIKIILTQWQ